jgi:enoyl-CoA hydratase/carnithine racemase
MMDEIETRTDGRLGRIVLNRPQAINALSLEMIMGIGSALERWAADPNIAAVLFTGNGGKGFCSGGDVRAARAHVIAGRADEADAYFAAEYEMNGLIARYAKPLVALTHGIVMGGGIGIAGHCRFRITQPGARFAMPESAIGFFSDVGVNAILAKAPVNRALLFLMSGASVGAADALALGLADAAVATERAEAIAAALAGAVASSDPERAIVALMEADSIDAGAMPFCAAADLLPSQVPSTPATFIAEIAATSGLEDYSGMLATRSPTALSAIFYSHLAARRVMDVKATLAADLRLAAVMAREPDFAEGVRAVLVDKDQRPRWSPSALAAVDIGPILAALAAPAQPLTPSIG